MQGGIDSAAIQMLDWLVLQKARSGRGSVSIAPFVDQFLGGDQDVAREALELLIDRGSVTIGESGDARSVQVTVDGVQEAQSHSSTRADLGRRASFLRRALLRWMYGREQLDSGSVEISEFVQSEASQFLGEQFQRPEVDAQVGELAALGLISVHSEDVKNEGQTGRLTEQGRECVRDYSGLIPEYLARDTRLAQ